MILPRILVAPEASTSALFRSRCAGMASCTAGLPPQGRLNKAKLSQKC